MRWILGIDTASPNGSVALASDGASLAVEPLLPGEHSSGLSHACGRLLSSHALAIGSLAGIAVSKGPGSFTGLRIGLAWAKGVALGLGIPILLPSAHEAAAHAHRARGRRVATLIAAERDKVEAALWETGDDRTALLWGPESIDEEDAVGRILAAANGRGPAAVGSVVLAPATERLRIALETQAGASILPPALLAPSVAEIGDRLLLAGGRADWITASPAYGRAPNARKPER